MARTGNFGRQPRAVPNLQATLLALAREQERTRDQNIMEAWQKGGMFEGKKVTDSLVIKHWKDRLTDISPDDPLYDSYKNAVTQLEYGIAESKMTASYATKGKTDAQMVAFYMKWAKKVPKDSELYRILQRDAGQYMRNVQARSKADIAAAKERRYVAYMNDIAKGTRAGDKMLELLEQFATKGFVDPSGRWAIPAPTGMGRDGTASGALYNLGPEDAEEMMRMISNLVTPTGGRRGEDGRIFDAKAPQASNIVLFHDDAGRPVTAAGMTDFFERTLGKDFDGTISLQTVQTAIQKSKRAVQKLIDHAEATGHVTDANRFKSQMEGLVATGRIVDAIPVQEEYNDIVSAFERAVGAPGATAQDIVEADRRKTDALLRLGNDPRIATDDARRAAIIGEANKEEATLTLSESFTQFEDRDGEPAKANAINAQRVEFATEEADLLRDPESGWVLTPGIRHEDGTFEAKAGGKALGAAPVEDIMRNNPGGARVTMVPRANGSPVQVLVPAQLVPAFALDSTGEAVELKGSPNIMKVYAVSYSGEQHLAYGVNVEGKEMFTDEFPGDPNKAKLLPRANGEWALDLSGTIPVDGTQVPYLEYGQPGIDDFGQSTPPPMRIDPMAAFKFTQPSTDAAGGYDPHTMFPSLTVALHISTPEGRKNLDIIKDTPEFKRIDQYDRDIFTGTKRDPATGEVTVPGNPALVAKVNAEMADALNVNSIGYDNWLVKKDNSWSKGPDSIKPATPKPLTTKPTDLAAAGWTPANDRLPKWQGVVPEDSAMAGINKAFDPNAVGRLALGPALEAESRGRPPEIRLGKAITIPGVTWTPPAVAGGAVTGNQYSQTQTVAGSSVKPPKPPSGSSYKPPTSSTRERL